MDNIFHRLKTINIDWRKTRGEHGPGGDSHSGIKNHPLRTGSENWRLETVR